MNRHSIPIRISVTTIMLVFAQFHFAANAIAAEADSAPVSQAEDAVFNKDHLNALKVGAYLQYSFSKRGTLEAAADDMVTLKITKIGSNGREVDVKCLSGNRKVDLPLEGELKGNPVILCFLERDIREMKRLTGGSMNYYRKRIRMALAEAAKIRPTTITIEGKSVQATEVMIDPYSNDQARVKFTKHANKTYRFVLSEAVQGGVVELQSVMHEEGKPSSVMVEEKFTLKK
jgi:hypothetical protein